MAKTPISTSDGAAAPTPPGPAALRIRPPGGAGEKARVSDSSPRANPRPLTAKQQKFVAAYTGNGTEAARLAGYSGDDNALAVAASNLLKDPKIRSAIEARPDRQAQAKKDAAEAKALIATRAERQEFWSRLMNDVAEDPHVRLKASELLGKSEADFTEKQRHEGANGEPLRISIDISEGA